jgi:ATP-dependent Clp protease ATP-binding subunit ClpA
MKLSSSVDLIWRLAAREMAAGDFNEIEPEHFCMALLKFAELPASAIKVEGENAGVAEAVAIDVELVREALERCGIESTRARRKLRAQLGKGSTPHVDGQIHRSAASRALFITATKLAHEFGSGVVTPLHLLTALVQSPTPAVAQALLGKATAQPPPAVLPLLDNHGKDLVKEASEGRLTPDSSVEASSKAVIQILLRKERKSVLLVSDSDALIGGIAAAIALAIIAKAPPAGLRGRRLIDIAGPPHKGHPIPPQKEKEELERLRALLVEGVSHPEVILLVPKVEVEEKSAQGGQWTRLLRETLAKGSVQLICRATPAVFDKHLRKDPVWKRRAEAVWIRPAAFGSVPREL